MTGQDIQDKVDAIVADLQTNGKGQITPIAIRGVNNNVVNFPLTSDANGVIDPDQLNDLQAVVNPLKPVADTYNAQLAPVQAASDAFKTASAPHQALMDAAAQARKDLSDALSADAAYQAAKTALDNARANPAYIAARDAYQKNNVSENYGNLQDAKGKYFVTA